MFCELKQAVLSLGQELTPAEIRIGWGTPSWVAETGIPTFYHPVQTSDPASGLWVRPHRFDDRLIRHGSQTCSRCSGCSCGFGNWLIRHGYQTHVHADESVLKLENRLI